MIVPGAILAEKFRVERVLGQGGMGVVLVARHIELDARVAIKILRDTVAGDADAVERFQREARAVAKLRGDHVCRVSDVGRLADGAPYLVMELLEGSDLAAISKAGALPVATAVDYVLQACVAVAEAHAAGIIHRDLKPANLFLTKRLDGTPLVKVLDFGIAKAAGHGGADAVVLTQTEQVIGSPAYMSPEQFRSSRTVDARTDIWSLGVILYQLVAQRLPFSGGSVTELAIKVATDPPEPLGGDSASSAVAPVIMRCLEKDPAARYADVAALAAALGPCGGPTAPGLVELIGVLGRAHAATGQSLEGIERSATIAAPGGATVATAATSLSGAAGSIAVTPVIAATRASRVPIAVGAGLAAVGVLGLVVALVALLGQHGTPAPAVAPADPHAAELADLHAKFETALAADRCMDAAQASYYMQHAGETTAVLEPLNKRLGVCTQKFLEASSDPSKPASLRMLELAGEESFDGARYADVAGQMRLVLDYHPTHELELRARSIAIKAACHLHDRATAVQFAQRIAAGPERDALAGYCKSVGGALD